MRETQEVADWSPLRALLADVTDSITLGWAELDELVGGLPRSAYIHAAFWKGDRSAWRGFTTTTVRVGEAVTFVRRPISDMARIHDSPTTDGRPPSAADVILVGCVKSKLDVPARAKDLYTSALFRKARVYAERSGAPWFILSAEHGLVDPEERLEPYDLRLSGTSRGYRNEWGVRVVQQLLRAVGQVEDRAVEVHAGSAYSNAIRGLLIHEGARVLEPLSRLTMGARLAWYNAPAEPDAALTPLQEPATDVTELVGKLSRERDAVTPDSFLASDGERLRSPGLYSWWVDHQGARELSAGLGQPVNAGLVYAGLAGATRSRSGRKSKNTLWGRIKTMHLGGRHEFSTFRLSLGSILAHTRGHEEIDEAELTTWMHNHLRLVAVPVADADTLGEVETDVLALLDPPLNLAKVERNSLRVRLSALRREYGTAGS